MKLLALVTLYYPPAHITDNLLTYAEDVDGLFDSLSVGGVLSIITFHSLEDRAAKNMFRGFTEGCTCPKDFPVCVCGKTPRGQLPFKSCSPSEAELENNPRSRSARLRSVIKLK